MYIYLQLVHERAWTAGVGVEGKSCPFLAQELFGPHLLLVVSVGVAYAEHEQVISVVSYFHPLTA